MRRLLDICLYFLLLPLIIIYRFLHRKHYICDECGAEASWVHYENVTALECSKDVFHNRFREVKE